MDSYTKNLPENHKKGPRLASSAHSFRLGSKGVVFSVPSSELSVDQVVVEAADAPLPRVPVSLSPEKRFEEYLQSRGLRQTEQRRFLVQQVFSTHEHFDADALIEQLPRKGESNYVSRPTVYRTLKEFVDAGLLRSFQLDGRTVFEHDYGYPQHDHLYCTKCRGLFEFQSEALLKLRDEVAADNNFRVANHRLIIQGVCQACSKQRRKKRKQDLI